MTRTHEIKLDGYGAHTTLAEDRPIMLLGTAESYGIETLHVVSGKSWEGLTVTATFNAPDGTSTDILMDTDGNVVVPSEATAKSGSGRIVFTGVSNGIQRISCDLEYFVVAHSAINGVQSGGTAPSWFEQAVTRFMPAGGTAGQVLTKLTDTDFEAEWQDSKGGADGKSAYAYAVEGGYTGTEAEFAAKLAAEKLPNPYPLTFTGAVNETYDGSSAKTIEIPSGGGGSVPKPLTYDYMPEGYPTKAMGTVTVMEEQVVEFASSGDGSPSVGVLTTTFTPVEGQTYIVNWDGTEHECVCSLFNGRFLVLGNLSIIGAGDDTGEPFIYLNVPHTGSEFETFDTASSHTISVKKTGEIVTPMAEEFLPVASEDNYGAVKKSEVVSAYNFLRQVVHDQMIDAISAFKTGNASIVWAGRKVIDASYNSSDDAISVTFADEPLKINTYKNEDGFYYYNLGSTTYAELQGRLMRIGDNDAFYTVLTTEGTSDDNTLRVWAKKISIDDEFRGNAVVLHSSTDKSNKRFKITVDDSGTIAVTEVV